MLPQFDMPYHPPRPRGRPPLGDRQRNRLTLKLSGASRGPEPKPEIDESEAPMEEQFVLRVLPEMSVRFSKLVAERQIHDHLEIKFRDERNAVVKFDNEHYVARLVDLPTITESYRTLDKKQMLKTADICQMLVIERKVTAAEIDQVPLARGIDIIHPDGLAPSLADVRWSRFRPRIPRSRIDAIEKEVLRLLEDDAQAMAVKFEICDDQGEDGRATPSIDIMSPVTLDDLNTPMVADEDAASSVAEDMEFDENLAAELEQGLEELDDDDDEDDESEEEDEEEFQPNNERAMQMKLLGEEIAELERTIVKKNADLGSAPNPIIYRRFEDIIQRLQQELEAKKQQLEHYNKELEDESRQQQQRGEEESKE